MMATEHDAAAVAASHGGTTVYLGVCSCGWNSTPDRRRARAEADAAEHADVHGG